MLGHQPRVFVSYAHDSENVRRLAQVLRQCGVEVQLDRAPGRIEDADFVIVVASPAYRLGAEGPDGSQPEAAILRDKLTEDRAEWTRRILPVVLPDAAVTDIPAFLQPYSATHYSVDELTPDGVADLLTAMSVRPRQADRRARRRTRLALPIVVFVAALVATVVIWGPWSSDAENAWHAATRGNGVSLVPEGVACGAGVNDKIDLDTGLRGHDAQPQTPAADCASEGGLADLIVDPNELHTASAHLNTIVLVPRDKRNPDGGACHALLASRDAILQHSLPLDALRAGDQFCVHTDKGHVALVTMRKISAGSKVSIDFVVWEKTPQQ